MSPEEYLDRLDQRRRYLDARIVAKKTVGWDTVYDQSERDALAWVLGVMGQAMTEPVPDAEAPCPHPEEKRQNTTVMGGGPRTFLCLACGEEVRGVA